MCSPGKIAQPYALVRRVLPLPASAPRPSLSARRPTLFVVVGHSLFVVYALVIGEGVGTLTHRHVLALARIGRARFGHYKNTSSFFLLVTVLGRDEYVPIFRPILRPIYRVPKPIPAFTDGKHRVCAPNPSELAREKWCGLATPQALRSPPSSRAYAPRAWWCTSACKLRSPPSSRAYAPRAWWFTSSLEWLLPAINDWARRGRRDLAGPFEPSVQQAKVRTVQQARKSAL